MKKLFLILLLVPTLAWATSYTEFYVQTTGNNLNAGSTTEDAANYTDTGGTWVQSTGVFTVSSGDPSANASVTNGAWASVYPDAYVTNVFIGRVTAVDSTTITVSLTAKAGVAPINGTTDTSIRVGGAWKGPGLGIVNDWDSQFPFLFVENTLTNASSNFPRFNFLAATYNITNTINQTNDGPMFFSGYTSTPGDGGKWTVDGGTSIASYQLFATLGDNNNYTDWELKNNGNSGAAYGMQISGQENVLIRVVVHDVRNIGISVGNLAAHTLIECEAYNCNQGAGGGGVGGIGVSNGGNTLIRCYSHDNACAGFAATAGAVFIDCVSFNNTGGLDGFYLNVSSVTVLKGCIAYNNARDGVHQDVSAGAALVIENCAIFSNGGYGVANKTATTLLKNGSIYNCVFGSGTEANASGDVDASGLPGIDVQGSITYASNETPWVDPANGDFNLSSGATIKAAGLGNFTTWTTNGYVTAFPDIGAVQAASTNTSLGGASSHTFAQ